MSAPVNRDDGKRRKILSEPVNYTDVMRKIAIARDRLDSETLIKESCEWLLTVFPRLDLCLASRWFCDFTNVFTFEETELLSSHV